jgi:hypothetical protein
MRTPEALIPLAQLNIEMDALAATVHCMTFPGKMTENQEVLPAERRAFNKGSVKMTNKAQGQHCGLLSQGSLYCVLGEQAFLI